MKLRDKPSPPQPQENAVRTRPSMLAAMLVFASYDIVAAATVVVPTDTPLIQDAIFEAGSGDTIILLPGTYHENVDFLGRAITVRSTDPTDVAVVEATIINGSALGSVVKFVRGEGPQSILDGVTITNGLSEEGGGLKLLDSSPTIRNCHIKSNVGSYPAKGGGMFCRNSNPLVVNSTFRDNQARMGGAVHAEYSGTPTFVECTFLNNKASCCGGALSFISGADAQISNCTFENNAAQLGALGNVGGAIRASSFSGTTRVIINSSQIIANSAPFGGGGVYCNAQCDLTLTDCLISGNQKTDLHGGGGGVQVSNGGTLTMERCTIVNNYSGFHGGGLDCTGDCAVRNSIFAHNTATFLGGGINLFTGDSSIRNCLIANNLADEGGGILAWGSPRVIASTISGNSAEVGGGFYARNDAQPILNSNIIWGNDAGGVGDQIVIGGVGVNLLVAHSTVQGGAAGVLRIADVGVLDWGPGNIDANPLFVDAAENDFHLSGNSPCRDSGDPAYALEPEETDIDGEARVFGTAVDMGTDEFHDCNLNGVPDSSELANGSSEDCDANTIPDECENTTVDCNENSVWDACDLSLGTSVDCNGNGVPDECDLSVCGDGCITGTEACDDGNTEAGDGCGPKCQVEQGACCFDKDCSIATDSECLNTGGTFFGFNTPCDAPDADGDGLRNECDGCPVDPNKTKPEICGCGVDDNLDSDNDGVPDCIDQCPGADDAAFGNCAEAIPTVSVWGLVVLTLLLLTAGKVFFSRRPPGAKRSHIY